MSRILLSIDGSDFVAYASLASAKRASKRAKGSVRIVKETTEVSGAIVCDTVYSWDFPQKR